MQWAAFFAALMVFVVLSEARSFSSNIKKDFPSKKISKLRTLRSNKLRGFDNTGRILNANLSPLKQRQNYYQTRDDYGDGTPLPMSTVRVMAFAASCFLSEEFWHYVCFDKIDDPAWEYEGPEWVEACFYSIRFVMYYVEMPEQREDLDNVFEIYDHGATCERLGHRRGEIEAALFWAEKCGKDVLYLKEELPFLEELTILIHLSCTKNAEELENFENAWGQEEYNEDEMAAGETKKRAEKKEMTADETEKTVKKKELLEKLVHLLSSPREDTRRSVRSADTCITNLNNEFFGDDGIADIAVLQAAEYASYCITGDLPKDEITGDIREEDKQNCDILLYLLHNITLGTAKERAAAVKDVNGIEAFLKCFEMGYIVSEIHAVQNSEETSKVKDAVDRYQGFISGLDNMFYDRHCSQFEGTKRETEFRELKKKLLDALSKSKK